MSSMSSAQAITKKEQTDTVRQIMTYYKRAEQLCADWHNDILHRRRLYDLDHYSQPPKPDEERFQDPSYTNTVDLAVGIILANKLKFEAFPWIPTPGSQKESEKIEKFLLGLIEVNNEREELHIPFEVITNFVRDGAGVVYSVWDENIEANCQVSGMIIQDPTPEDPAHTIEAEGFSEPPIRLQVIDPVNMFLIPGWPGRWAHVMRVEEWTVLDIEERFNVTIAKFRTFSINKKQMTKGKLIDYWRFAEGRETDVMEYPGVPNKVGKMKPTVQHALIFEGTEILPMQTMENYEDIPYTIGFFKPTSMKDPRGWGKSMIDVMEPPVMMIERAINRRQRQITVYSSLPIVTKTQPGRLPAQIDQSLGQVVQLANDESIEFPKWQGNPPDVELQIETLRSSKQQSGFSDLMYGAWPGRTSGFAVSLLVDQNRVRLQQPVEHMQAMWTRWAKKVLRLAANFAPEKVIRVYGKMNGKDFADQIFVPYFKDYGIRCLIEPEFPDEKTRKHAMALQARPWLSDETIMEKYLDIEQPGDEIQRKLSEQAAQHPIVQQYAVVSNLLETARLYPDTTDGRAAALVLKLLSNQGAPQGRPPVPGGAPNMLGTQSATGNPSAPAGNGIPYESQNSENLQLAENGPGPGIGNSGIVS